MLPRGTANAGANAGANAHERTLVAQALMQSEAGDLQRFPGLPTRICQFVGTPGFVRVLMLGPRHVLGDAWRCHR